MNHWSRGRINTYAEDIVYKSGKKAVLMKLYARDNDFQLEDPV
jgi:hypothetical protein